jgi:hypothetical protein
MTTADPAAEATVITLLGRLGLTPSPDELPGLVTAFELQELARQSLWAVKEARYESPALGFNAAPVFVDWAQK